MKREQLALTLGNLEAQSQEQNWKLINDTEKSNV